MSNNEIAAKPPCGMRLSLSLKTIFRAPIKTALTFLLIAAASFALFSRVADYAVTKREIDSVMSDYRGVAALDNRTPVDTYTDSSGVSISIATEKWLPDEWMSAFSDIPGVSMTDTRFISAGISEDYKRIYESDNGNEFGLEIFVIEGTFAGFEQVEDLLVYYFEDYTIIAGDFERCTCGAYKSAIPQKGCFIHDPPETIGIIYFDAAETMAGTNLFGVSYAESLEPGSRCIMVGSYSVNAPILSLQFPGFWFSGSDTIIELDGLPDDYLETAAFAHIRDIIERANTNLYTFDMVYTSDMRSIPRFNERKMLISKGRALTTEDIDNKNMVCVISAKFANEYSLGLGDKLTFELHDKLFSLLSGLGATAQTTKNVLSSPIGTVELEIIGIYKDTDPAMERFNADDRYYLPSAVFVPSHLLPIETIPADHKFTFNEFSVVVEDLRDIDAFLEKAEPLAKKFGTGLRFSDGGWSGIKDSIDTSAMTSALAVVSYLSAAGLALLLTIYLHIGSNKKTYAIMRALGMTRRKADNALAVPLGALAFVAIHAGGITGLVYTTRATMSALESLTKVAEDAGYVADRILPAGYIALCFLCELAFIALLIALFLWRMGKKPVLELLQDNTVRAGTKLPRNAETTVENAELPRHQLHSTQQKVCEHSPHPHHNSQLSVRIKPYSAFRHVTAYILRHIRRAKWKTAVTLTLTVVLIGAVGLLAITGLSYQQLFDEVEVKCVARDFSSSSVGKLSSSELISDFFYFDDFDVVANRYGTKMNLTNNFERYLGLMGVHLQGYKIDYAENYTDTSYFEREDDKLCLLGSVTAEALDISPGESVTLIGQTRYDFLHSVVMNEQRLAMLEAGELTYDELVGRLDELLEREGVAYTVAGIVHSTEQSINEGVFAPAGESVKSVYGNPFPLEYGEFILSDNEKLGQLDEFIYQLMYHNMQGAPSASFVVDSAEAENIGQMRDLLISLFPIAMAGAVLIGLVAPALLILQSSKEAAILRVLGATKKRVRCMLMFEQIGICVAGVALATGGLVIYSLELFAKSAETLALCGMLYMLGYVCAALTASVLVTGRKVLYLLQTKE